MLVVVSVAFWIDGEAKRQWVLHLIFMLDTVFNVHIFLLVSDKQIAGLTNNSYLAESHEVRHCIQKYQPLGEYVLDVAKVPIEGSLLIAWHHFEIFSCLLYFCFMVITMVDLCKSCRSGWIICCMLDSLRTIENLQQCLQMWLVLRQFLSLQDQTLERVLWLIAFQVSVRNNLLQLYFVFHSFRCLWFSLDFGHYGAHNSIQPAVAIVVLFTVLWA